MDLALPSAILLSIGDDADRYDGFRLFRAPGKGGCLGVVPLPFDLKEEGKGLSDVIAGIPFVVLPAKSWDDCCTPLYSL